MKGYTGKRKSINGRNIYTPLIVASKETGLEVDVEKTK
jgi:hypothetical protein